MRTAPQLFPDLDLVEGQGHDWRYTKAARAEVMGWNVLEGGNRSTVAKGPGLFGQSSILAVGEIPPDGATVAPEINELTGSILPTIAASRQVPDTAQAWETLVADGAVVAPPYNPWILVCTVEESDTLPEAVEAYATNISGFGYELTKLFPTEDEETGEPIAEPAEAKPERERAELFLKTINLETGGICGLMALVDRDVETIGWGTIEVLRDKLGQEAAWEYMRAYTVRLGRLSKPILCSMPVRHPVTGELLTVQRYRRFRTFVQSIEGEFRYFKSYGDPRFLNVRTGEYAATSFGIDKQGNALDATEVIYVRIHASHTPYGVPRWVGATPHVRAGREAAELMVDWFLNAPIGLKLAMVAGGSWNVESWKKMLDKLAHASRGGKNAWTIAGVEAETFSADEALEAGKDAPPRMELTDAAFELPPDLYKGQESLIDGSAKRVRKMFRLPAIYFGDSEAESNRAAADTGRSIGEEQVFVPIRSSRWENLLNYQVFPAMGINHFGFHLKGAVTGDNEATFRGLGPFVEGAGTTPNMLLKFLGEQTGTKPPLITEEWGDRPWALTQILLEQGIDPNLSVEQAVGEIQAAKEDEKAQAAEEAKMRFGGGGAPGAKGAPAKGGGKFPRAVAAKRVDPVAELMRIRDSLLEHLRGPEREEIDP